MLICGKVVKNSRTASGEVRDELARTANASDPCLATLPPSNTSIPIRARACVCSWSRADARTLPPPLPPYVRVPKPSCPHTAASTSSNPVGITNLTTNVLDSAVAQVDGDPEQ